MPAEKVACTECRAWILASTAARNGGRCEPCKQGRRAEITRAQQRAEKARARADAAKLRVDYWRPLVEEEAAKGYATLSDAQRLCYSVGQLEGEVFNGGFPRYFINSTGEQCIEAGRGLERLGAVACSALFEVAKAMLFGRSPVPNDVEARKQAVEAKAVKLAAPLEQIRLRFVGASEQCDLVGRIENHAKAHGLPRVVRRPFKAPESTR